MSATKKIKMLLVERDMTITDLAKKLNTVQSNISSKMKRNNFSEKELRDIAEALNCDYDIIFTTRDTGKQI